MKSELFCTGENDSNLTENSTFFLEPILRLLNLQLHTTLAFLRRRKNIFVIKTRHAIGCAVNFYNAGVITRDRRIGSWVNKID
jgi:hypothetical protein